MPHIISFSKFIFLLLFNCFTQIFLINIFFFNFILLLKFLSLLLPLLILVAFFTVFERKLLAAYQRRRGPNLVGVYGLLQAFSDALKLVSKESIVPSASNLFIFVIAPISIFSLSITS